MRKITRGDVPEVRERILARQGYKCAICQCSLKGSARGGACLDHCHDTGVIRGVLCRSCNGGEGKVKNAAIRYGGGKSKFQKWLKELLGYYLFHAAPKTQYIHPTFDNPEEKRVKRNAKARKKRQTKKVKK